MSPAILPQLSTAVSAGDGFAPSMPTMRPGTPVRWIRATKEAKVSSLRQPKRSKTDDSADIAFEPDLSGNPTNRDLSGAGCLRALLENVMLKLLIGGSSTNFVIAISVRTQVFGHDAEGD